MTTISREAPTVPATSGRHGLIQAVRRLGWGVADQGISSLSNFALGLFVARSFGASNFGAFTLAYITYTFVINAARGLATDPLLVRYSGDASRRWRRATSAATGTASGRRRRCWCRLHRRWAASSDPLGPVFVALGVGLPGLVLQDSWRFAFFASGRGAVRIHQRPVLDRAARPGPCRAAQPRGRQRGPLSARLRWDCRTGCSARGGTGEGPATPGPRCCGGCGPTTRYRFATSSRTSAISGAAQLRSYVLGAVAGLAAVGYVRASEILMGPFFVVLMGISQVAVPEASRVFHRNSRRLARFCFILGGSQAAAAVAWGLILITVFPLGPGPALLKELWMPTAQLLPAITLTVAAASFTTAATAGLRAMGVARRSLRAQLIGSAAYAIGGATGAVLGGALGASWGVTAAQVFAALVWWHQLRSALADHHAVAEVAR